MEPKYWWTIIGIAGLIIEIFSPGFFAGSLAVGAFCAAAVSLFTDALEYQLAAMAGGSLLAFFLIRPIWKKYLYKTEDVKSNADALIGKKGTVTESIDEINNMGRVAIDGDVWQAVSEDGAIIKEGDHIEVTDRDSIILTVKSTKK
mgnify:CR=1 FL=1